MNRAVSFIFTFRVKRVKKKISLKEKMCFFLFFFFFVWGEKEAGTSDIILALKKGISIDLNCVVSPI